MTRRLLPLVLVALLIGALPASAGKKGPKSSLMCRDTVDEAQALQLDVNGEPATGRFAAPKQKPTTLVVFAHGYGHDSDSWVDHMKKAAAEHGVLAVAMDYRGTYEQRNEDGSVTIRGWFVKEGAEDLVAATKFFRKACPSIKQTVLFGVSMGGNASGLALAKASEETAYDGTALFDYWFNVEGAVNAVETYAGASALAPVNEFAANAKADIEQELGGTPADNPEGYRDLAVVSHIDEIADSGVKGVMVVHALEDGLVPYNQSREIVAELAARQIPVESYTVGQKGDGESGTTITGYSGQNASPFAGHASERSDTHIVMVTAFERLWALVDDEVGFGMYTERFVN